MTESALLRFTVAAALMVGGSARAQEPAPSPSFGAVSVRPARPAPPPPGLTLIDGAPCLSVKLAMDPVHVASPCISARELIRIAYGLQNYQLQVGTADFNWIESDRFDIEASMDTATAPEQTRLMLQNALRDKFHLRLSREMAQLDVLALVVGPGGFKAPPLAAGEEVKNDSSGEQMKEGFNSVQQLVDALNSRSRYGKKPLLPGMRDTLDRPIVDETGIAGNYRLLLTLEGSFKGGAGLFYLAPDADWSGMLERQFGLKLVPKTEPVPIYTIVHIEHPQADGT